MLRRTLLSALAALVLGGLGLPGRALAQRVHAVPELDAPTLASFLLGRWGEVERCAARTETSSYVMTVAARIDPGPPPSTLHGARIALDVRGRPRDGALEACVRRSLLDALRRAPYAVPRAVQARQTSRITERPLPPLERPPPPYAASEVTRLLEAAETGLQSCLGLAGLPESSMLRVAVRPDGRLTLTSADLPPGASPGALACLASRVAALRVQSRPSRTQRVVHRLRVRDR